MRVTKLIICLFIFFRSTHSQTDEVSPVYGYHMRYGVQQAQRINWQESLRIIGGSQVTSADAVPHQAGIIIRLATGWSSVCGGSLISSTRVLTAAHCWDDGRTKATLFTIVLGSLTIYSGGTRIKTKDVTMHPLWNLVMYDIATVKIPSVSLSNTIQVIPLPTMAEVNLDFIGYQGLVTGYGKTSQAQNNLPITTSLHRTKVTVISNAVCQKQFFLPQIHDSHLCVDGSEGRGTCDGDSGGPLTVVHNNIRILIGVVSFGGRGGCESGSPSVFTRVTAFLTWIKAQM